ncbi:related to Casein kinase I homolog 3 [Saccharomycodes ludwigii]|uniref:non-specific serine/threonine protein kinase n=1 Tax=Saccharomycodes ludwigii TaxID=36035 RepID=A0A376BAR7_9ASCO|nr:hypothetical protein SCDLUD_001411 [Saccharomycodes ludwigii]KAH3901644.1 hypothetical protein SCDLUD_001411 [Saccharomycodes ludwigii]SSD61679.1 related to Casein kinase I homolog 3 [Saccharomycodes ludwigii]
MNDISFSIGSDLSANNGNNRTDVSTNNTTKNVKLLTTLSPPQLAQQHQTHKSSVSSVTKNTNTNNYNTSIKKKPSVSLNTDGNTTSSSNASTHPNYHHHQQHHQHIVGIHYALGSKIGEGSFGVIFEGVDILSPMKSPVAIKFEPRKSEAPQLRDEFRSYKILQNCKGIPQAYYYGQEGMHNVLVIDLLGPSLEDLFEWCGRRFSIKTTCMLAKQMISRIRTIHSRDLIYRDIKPDNFLISQYQRAKSKLKICCSSSHGDPNLVYVVDFGMAKQYRDPVTKEHIPYRERKSLSGTARYMSINTHLGREQSRRDDLESLGHVFFYFLRGSLPWQGLKAPNNKLKYDKIGQTKMASTPEFLCMNGKLPKQFGTYLDYCRNLKFEQEPDYDYLISLMDEVLAEKNLDDDGQYDWMGLNNGHGWDIRINRRSNLHGYGGGANHHGNLPNNNTTKKNNNNSNNNNNNNNNTNININANANPNNASSRSRQLQQQTRYQQQQLQQQQRKLRKHYSQIPSPNNYKITGAGITSSSDKLMYDGDNGAYYYDSMGSLNNTGRAGVGGSKLAKNLRSYSSNTGNIQNQHTESTHNNNGSNIGVRNSRDLNDLEENDDDNVGYCCCCNIC